MINKLEYFMALARVGHFGKAAEECGVSQPSFSTGIRQLEDQLGVLLVQRGARFQGLTPEGERVLEWSRRIVADTRAMKEEMRNVRHGLAGHVRIAAIPTALAMVQKLTVPFRARHPGVTFTVRSAASDEILTLLENFEIEAGITYLDGEALGKVQTVPLFDERYFLVLAKGSPFAGRGSVSWVEAAKLDLCLLTSDMQNRRIIDGYFRSAGTQVRPPLESNSVIALFSHLETGLWASILPGSLLQAFGSEGVFDAIPLDGPDTCQRVGLVAQLRNPAMPLVSALFSVAKSIDNLK